MIALADYVFYQEVYHGTMSENDFSRLIFRASIYVRRLIFGRDQACLPSTMEDRVRMAQCAVVDAMLKNEQGGGIVSETNDGVSVTYAASKSTATDGQRLYQAAAEFLADTGLMFQGVYSC